MVCDFLSEIHWGEKYFFCFIDSSAKRRSLASSVRGGVWGVGHWSIHSLLGLLADVF